MTTFFTADQHFGHKNIIEYSNRPFKLGVKEMDVVLISNWNSVVKPDDEVYVVGDFTLNDLQFAERVFKRLNGYISVIPGSHDRWIDQFNREQRDGYPLRAAQGQPVRILPPLYTWQGGALIDIVLCHYAMRSWDRSHYGTWHLFGHHHGHLAPYGLSFDIGVDCWDFYPVSLEQVRDKMKTLSPIVDYSKKGSNKK